MQNDNMRAMRDQMTSIAREVEPGFLTNRLILIIMPISAVLGFVIALINGAPFGEALASAVFMFFAVFLAWALAREFDPDYDWSAFLPVSVVIVGLAVRPTIWLDIPAMLGLMLFMRIVNRTVGPPATLGDSVVALVFIGLFAVLGNWVMVVGGLLALALDGSLGQPNARQWAFVLVGVIIAIAASDWVATPAMQGLSLPFAVFVVVTGLLYLAVLATSNPFSTSTDRPGYTLNGNRVQAAMVLGLGVTAFYALWQGDAGVQAFAPAWAAMLGVALYHVLLWLGINIPLPDLQQERDSHDATAD